MADVKALPQSGDLFAGKYLIERVIGSGKASLVFAARHAVTGKRFAIQWLLPGADHAPHNPVSSELDDADAGAADGRNESAKAGARAAEHLPSEANDLDNFRHPNVLEVYDVGEASGSHYKVMEWADGESLEARIARSGPLSLSEARRLLVPCMRGMHEAHAAGLLHRDLKPANIYICQATRAASEVVKVLDFEVPAAESGSGDAAALVVRRATTDSEPYYRAPEQLGGLEIDHRADVYAFGAILYQVLSGRPPFAPLRHLNHDELTPTPTRLAALQARTEQLPPGAEKIIGRAMARDVSQRFQTLHELADALEAFCRTTQRRALTGKMQLDGQLDGRSVREAAAHAPQPHVDASSAPFADEPSISRNRPWPRPPAVLDEPPREEDVASRARAVIGRPGAAQPSRGREHSQARRELTAPRALPEWSETSQSRPMPEWSEASASRPMPEWDEFIADPGSDRGATQHTPFHTELPPAPGLPSVLPERMRRLRNNAVYIASGLAVVALSLVLMFRWISRDTDVVASFDAIASSDVTVVEFDEPATQPAAVPVSPQPAAAADLPRGISPDSVRYESDQQALRPAAPAVQAEPPQLARTSEPQPAPEDDFAAVLGQGSDSNETGPVYRLPLRAPNAGSAERQAQTPKSRPARPTIVAKPVSAKPAPARRPQAAPVPDSKSRPAAPPEAASGDRIPMQLM